MRRARWMLACGLVLAMAGGHSAGQPECRPVVAELSEHINPGTFPSDAARWHAAERIWGAAAEQIRTSARRSKPQGTAFADLIQGFTHDLFREAVLQGRHGLADELADIWMTFFAQLVSQDHIRAFYPTPHTRIGDVHFGRRYEMWVDPDGIEATLEAAIFLAGATDVAAAMARRSPGERSRRANDFLRRVGDVAHSHFARWGFHAPGLWQVRGWGCNGSGMTLLEFTRRRLGRQLANARAPHCDAPTDFDLLIATGIVNLLVAADLAPDVVVIPAADRQALLELIQLQARFLASRLTGRQAACYGISNLAMDFDPGSWAMHGDFAYATDEQLRFPTRQPPPKVGVGWDFSHGARIAWTVETLAAYPAIVGQDFDWTAAKNAFAWQVACRVVDGDPDLPLFRNYLDGSNGWYRVNYSGRKDTGTPPYGLSRAYFSSPWARQGSYDPQLKRVASGAWRLLSGATAAHCFHFQRHYVDGAYWTNAKPTSQPMATPEQLISLLPFLATAPVR